MHRLYTYIIGLCAYVLHVCTQIQYLHPFEVKGYKETVRALRMIGRDCIMKRIKAVEAGEQIPRDILSSILQVACQCIHLLCIYCTLLPSNLSTATKESVNIEDLVDDFITFYVAGMYVCCFI